jgi:hypothetical protein
MNHTFIRKLFGMANFLHDRGGKLLNFLVVIFTTGVSES